MHGMRGRLMAYTRGMPAAKTLRASLSSVESLAELEGIIASHMAAVAKDIPA